jgi:hypothetical protein
MFADVLQDSAASIFRMEAEGSSETKVNIRQTTWHHTFIEFILN